MSDNQAVKTVLDGLVAAWNAGDADAFGVLFSDDATYVTFTGITYRGREAITQAHRELFTTHLNGTQLFQEVLDLRWVTPAVVVVVTRSDTYKGNRPRGGKKAQTQVLVHGDRGLEGRRLPERPAPPAIWLVDRQEPGNGRQSRPSGGVTS